jgi:multidrug efflux pump subunit AcrB
MNITQFAIEKKRITGVSLFLILITGIMTYFSMPRSEDPGFIIRTAQIQTIFPGASPERVELLITDKLEKRIQEMPEIDFVNSISKSGISIIMVNIKESYTEMQPIWDKLRRKVNLAKGSLPSGIAGPFLNDEFGDVYGTVIAFTAEGYSYAEMKEIADVCRDELLLIEEVAKVDIHGIQDERVFVEFNNARLAELGISPGQLQNILSSRNIIFPGGELYTDDEQIALEPSGNFESVEELNRTVIKLPGNDDLIYLGDMVNILRGYIDPPASLVDYEGSPSLILAISLREGGNIINLGEAVRQQLERFRSVYPIGIEFDILYFQPDFVSLKIKNFTKNLLQAVMIVVVVMLVFLGFRTGLVIASLIPMAMVMALMIMGFLNIGLDQMSLAALIIALGMLVDNAIVMSESIMVSMSEGKPPVQAAIESAKELRIPLLTSSLTTAAAFLPIYLAESTTGEYTAPIFEVVTITLLSSWVLALTMTPLLCVKFLKVKKKHEGESYDSKFYRFYRWSLLTLLRHPVLTILGTLILFFGALQLGPYIPAIFFPANDKPVMYGELEFPIGTPLEKTQKMVKQLENYINAQLLAEFDENGEVTKHGIVNWATFMGAGAPRYQLSYGPEPPNPGYAYMVINVTDRWRMDELFIPNLNKFCFNNFPDLTANFSPLPLGPPVEAPVQVRISGKNADIVFQLVDKVKTQLDEIPGTKDINDDWGHRTKKLFVRINQPRAQRAGLTSEDIAISLQSILSGIEITDYREQDEVIPVILRSVAADRKDIGKLESHNIYDQASGHAIPLKQVADVEIQFEPAKILRRDRLKTVTVQSQIQPGSNAISIAQQVDTWLKEESKTWPVGYKYELGGEIESSGKANDSIMAKLPIAALLIILLLVAQFDSLRRPVIILLTIPLGLIGVFVGLFITQEPLGFVAFLGVISLSGIVINNAIVLIDRIKIEQEVNGLEPRRAIVEAGQRRIRPILLTTGTTVGGLVPLWLGGGPMFEAMAVAILFGLIFATVLTLGFVPTLYSIFFRIKFQDYRYQS